MSVDGKSAVCTADSLISGHDEFLQSLGEADLPTSLVDDQRIETQVTRAKRWRYPDWPSVCEASVRRREKRRRARPDVVTILSSESPPKPVGVTLVRRYGISGLFSMALHAAVLVTLGVHVLEASLDNDDNVLYVIGDNSAGDAASERPQALEISVPSHVQVQSAGRFSSPVSAPTIKHDPGALPPTVSLATFAKTTSGPVGDVFALFGKDGDGLAQVGTGQEGAEFFGVRAAGKRFVFIVDCSCSMTGRKWKDATSELLAAVGRLGEDKSFYVVFFDGESHPMFGPASTEPDLMPATEDNLERFRQWLATVQLGYHTRPASSVALALALDPDGIYLLSDGEFEDQTAALLRDKNLVRVDRAQVPQVIVHTIGFHSHLGQRVLERIAKENGGRYTFVPRPPWANGARRKL